MHLRTRSTVGLALLSALGLGACASDPLAPDALGTEAATASDCGPSLAVVAATASANDGNAPANSIDGDLTTRWSALGRGAYLTLDLGQSRALCSLGIAWYQGNTRRNTFTIAVSSDGASFTQVFSGTSSGTTAGVEYYGLSTATGRYVRVVVNGNTVNDWASISEVVVRQRPVASDGGTDGAASSTSSLAAPVFDGTSGYVEIPDADEFSQPTRGGLTVEAWIRPDSLSMPRREGSGYVHWMGKGGANQHEWVARMYQAGNSEGRNNRISFYAFNLSGGLGAGSYFEDTVTVGQWIHVVGLIDATRTHIYKNGVERDADLLSGYSITPRNGSAPLRIGTRDFNSFFQGSVARVAVYGGVLPAARIAAHYQARSSTSYDQVIMGESSLVGYWRLDETSGTVARDATGRHHGSFHGGVTVGRTQWQPR